MKLCPWSDTYTYVWVSVPGSHILLSAAINSFLFLDSNVNVVR